MLLIWNGGGFKRWIWLLPLVATTVFYGLAYLICRLAFDVSLVPSRIPYDFGLLVTLAYLLFAIARRGWAYVTLLCLLIGTLYVGSAAKIAYLGRPILPDDIYSISALVRILGPLGWLAVVLPLCLIAALLVLNLSLRGVLRKIALSFLIILPAAAAAESSPIYGAMDQFWGNTPWDQRENFVWRGGTVELVQETLRSFAQRKPAPDQSAVNAALKRRQDEFDIEAHTKFIRQAHPNAGQTE